MEKLTILFVSPHADGYGASRSLLNNVIVLQKKGIECIVLTPRPGLLNHLLTEKGIENLDCDFKFWTKGYKFGGTHKAKTILKFLYNWWQATRISLRLRDRGISLVHTNDFVTDFGIRIAQMLKVPHVMTCRALLFEQFGIDFELGEEETLDRISRGSSLIICNSHSVFRRYSKYFSQKNVKIVHSAIVDTHKPNLKRYNRIQSKVKFVFVGRYEQSKGQLLAISAVARLLSVGYSDFSLDFFGDAFSRHQQDYLDLMHREVMEQKLTNHVSINSFVPDIEDKLHQYDIGLFCSPMEGVARVILEYMAAGLGVIASNTGDTPYIIQDGYNGHLFEPGNAVDLAEKMSLVLDDPLQIEFLGRNAYASIDAKYSIQRASEELLEAYRALK